MLQIIITAVGFELISQLAHVLGNGKPSTLIQVERSIWRALLRMATGSTAEVEIANLLMEWRTMLDTWERDGQGPLDFSFFDLCTSSVNHYLHQYLHLTNVYNQYLQSCKMSRIWMTPMFLLSQLMLTYKPRC